MGSRTGQNMAVTGAKRSDQRGDIFCQLMLINRAVRQQHFTHTRKLGCFCRDRFATGACDQHMDIATDLQGGGHGIQGGGSQGMAAIRVLLGVARQCAAAAGAAASAAGAAPSAGVAPSAGGVPSAEASAPSAAGAAAPG